METENTTNLDQGSQRRHERIESDTRGFKKKNWETGKLEDNVRFQPKIKQ